MHEVHAYAHGDQEAWDGFVHASRNGTFLFNRGFMDYHADRFADFSLIVRGDGGAVRALLPANRDGPAVHSHQGLTYGGFVIDESMGAAEMLSVLDATRTYLARAGVEELHYKPVPHAYHRLPSEEDRYALVRAGAALVRSDVLSIVATGRPGPVQKRRVRGARKAAGAGIEVRPASELAAFWTILEDVLRERHATRPVHTLAEISMLAARFPAQIRLHGAFKEDRLVAGVLMFETPMVAHAQYIAAAPEGREAGALDLLFLQLIDKVYAGVPYFDFGASTEQAGRHLNEGLAGQKEGFGARTMVQDAFVLRI
jgi:hypothetical protein